MTKLIFDLIAVDKSSDGTDAITISAPRVRGSVRGSGVVTPRKVTVTAPGGEQAIEVEPGELDVRIVSGKQSENLSVVVPDEERVLLSDLIGAQTANPNELLRLWAAIRDIEVPTELPATNTYTRSEIDEILVKLQDSFEPKGQSPEWGVLEDLNRRIEDIAFRTDNLERREPVVGIDGQDGHTPTIGENGNWFINGEDTGLPSRGERGEEGMPGPDGPEGPQGPQGEQGPAGEGADPEALADLLDRVEMLEGQVAKLALPVEVAPTEWPTDEEGITDAAVWLRMTLARYGETPETVKEIPFRLDTSSVTNMSYMFYGCSSLTSIPELDISSVTNMSYMFSGCSSLTSIPELDTSSVTDMSYMFYGCSSLTDENARLVRNDGTKPKFRDKMIHNSELTREPLFDADGNPID